MRRTSVLLALAAIVLTGVVAITYVAGLKHNKPHVAPTPDVSTRYSSQAKKWRYQKDDPTNDRPVVQVEAESFRGTKAPSTFELKTMWLRLFNKSASKYTLVRAASALFDEGSGVLRSEGPVTVVMSVPIDVLVSDDKLLAKYVHIETTGVLYDTRSGKASTNELARFVFPAGGGQAVGAEYDPTLRILHLKSAVSLDWIGSGPPENKLHVEASDLVYKELEQKIYLTPWSRMQRQTLTINAQNSVVTLDEGRLHQIDSVNAAGTDNRNGRQVGYSAAAMTALFDEDGALKEILGQGNAKVSSAQKIARTTLTGDRADLIFDVSWETVNGKEASDSSLRAVTADGHAVAESQPLPQPGVLTADTRILRSEHIFLNMRPGGQEVQEISAPGKASLEFKPNRPDGAHRTLDASQLKVTYGDNSYVESLRALNAKTRTDKPPISGKPSPPAFTWSDELSARFKPGSNEIDNIDQVGHFRFQEGDRKANSARARLQQAINRIDLQERAYVSDAGGSTAADKIVMDQASGDMQANGNVRSVHQPDTKQKPGTSMLDASQAMEAQAGSMTTRDNNTEVHYQDHAVIWQGANRISADSIDIDRDEESLHAKGNVVSELVDNRGGPDAKAADTTPLFTTVRAPDLVYHDGTRLALYTGGVTLERARMVVNSDRMQAVLTPKTTDNSGDSSLDHAVGDGHVKVFETLAGNRNRTGTGEHCEYFTKNDEVILSGGSPQFVDTQKGITRGRKLTYFSGEDKLIVDGEAKQQAFTKLKKK